MQDFLNDQIDEAELVGDSDMLTGLIEEEDELQFDRAEDAPSVAELRHEERQLGSQSVANLKRAPAEDATFEEAGDRSLPRYQTESHKEREPLYESAHAHESSGQSKVQIQAEKLQDVNKAIFDSSAQLQNILGMNAINRKPSAHEGVSRHFKPGNRRNKERPSFLRNGSNPSNGITIGRMDQEQSPDPNMQMNPFGARVQFPGHQLGAHQSPSPPKKDK